MVKIGVVAPGRRLEPESAARVSAIAKAHAPDADLTFHPQCFLSEGHFAGPDAARAAAFLDFANDGGFDAIWFARGGYGACRIAPDALPQLNAAGLRKTYLGYSDAGFLLAGLYKAGAAGVLHGPMPADILRNGGEEAVRRALDCLTGSAGAQAALEPAAARASPRAAFNMTVLSQLIGTSLQPDLAGHVLCLEEVSEHHYRIDRTLFHILNALPRLSGLLLGRCSDIPANDIPFGLDEVEIAKFWCAKTGTPFLGRADIGHDVANKLVRFGA